MSWAIYKIQNKINNKVYIGYSDNYKRRFNQHKKAGQNYTDSCTYPLYKDMFEQGLDNFEFSIIEEIDNYPDTLKRERFWIREYKSNIHKYESDCGYNRSDGGDGGGNNISKEQREKVSKAQKGRKRSPEYRLSLSINSLNKNYNSSLTANDFEKIYNLFIENKLTDKEIAEECKVNLLLIINVRQFNKSKIWDLLNLDGSKIPKEINHNTRTVLNESQVKEIYNLFLESKLSIRKIAKKYNVYAETIRSIREGKRWKHLNLDLSKIDKTFDPAIKLTEKEVKEIYGLFLENKLSLLEISKIYNVSSHAIGNIRKGVSWKHLNLDLSKLPESIYAKYKLDEQKIKEIKELFVKNISNAKISKKYNVCPETIRSIRLNKTWNND